MLLYEIVFVNLFDFLVSQDLIEKNTIKKLKESELYYKQLHLYRSFWIIQKFWTAFTRILDNFTRILVNFTSVLNVRQNSGNVVQNSGNVVQNSGNVVQNSFTNSAYCPEHLYPDRILYPVQCRTVKSTEFWIIIVQNSRARPEFWTLSRVLYLHTEFAYVFWVLCTFTGHVTEFWTRYVRILYNLPKFWKLVYRIQYQNSAYVLCPMMWQIILVNLNNSG